MATGEGIRTGRLTKTEVDVNFQQLADAAILSGQLGGQTAYGGVAAGDTFQLFCDAVTKAVFVKLMDTYLSLGTGATERARIDANGLITVPGMHGATGNTTSAQTITSGDWTPTLTGVANVTSSVGLSCQWLRVGSVVFCSGGVAVTPTAATTNTSLGISLPIAPASFSNSSKLGGAAAFVTGATSAPAQIIGDTANLRASMVFVSLSTAQHIFRFSFGYLVT